MTNPRQTTIELNRSASDSTASAINACEWPAMPAKSLAPASTALTASPIKVARKPRFSRLSSTPETTPRLARNEAGSITSLHRLQQFVERDAGEARGRVAHGIGDDEFALMQNRAAGVNHVRHVAFALGFVRGKQRFAKAANYARGVVQVEQERAEAIFAHRADAMAQHQPAGFRFNGRTAVADLNEFPRLRRREQDSGVVPEMNVVGEHQQDVLVILAGQHCVTPVYFARKQRHAFVLHRGTVQSDKLEMNKVRGFQELREDDFAVVRGVRRVV